MPVLLITDIEGGTVEQYDEVDEILDGTSPDNAPEGLISHTAGETDTGLYVADVWESHGAMQRFHDGRLADALEEAGVPPTQPRLLPVHTHLDGRGDEAAVIVIQALEGMTGDDYDRLTADMPSHAGDGSEHPAVAHLVAIGGDGLVVVDVWGSEEEFEAFAESEMAPCAGGWMGETAPRIARLRNHVPVKTPVAH
jgi:hypothetical protein